METHQGREERGRGRGVGGRTEEGGGGQTNNAESEEKRKLN